METSSGDLSCPSNSKDIKRVLTQNSASEINEQGSSIRRGKERRFLKSGRHYQGCRVLLWQCCSYLFHVVQEELEVNDIAHCSPRNHITKPLCDFIHYLLSICHVCASPVRNLLSWGKATINEL